MFGETDKVHNAIRKAHGVAVNVSQLRLPDHRTGISVTAVHNGKLADNDGKALAAAIGTTAEGATAQRPILVGLREAFGHGEWSWDSDRAHISPARRDVLDMFGF